LQIKAFVVFWQQLEISKGRIEMFLKIESTARPTRFSDYVEEVGGWVGLILLVGSAGAFLLAAVFCAVSMATWPFWSEFSQSAKANFQIAAEVSVLLFVVGCTVWGATYGLLEWRERIRKRT
jgi:hypothetical protein